MARALALGAAHGIGCVALAETNHWMRGGSYGWQAADAGAIGICWTNTLANVPPWGAVDPRIGNNPLIVAVPRPRPRRPRHGDVPVFGRRADVRMRRAAEALPVDGGYDADGRLTQDASAILASGRLLPIGFWKGSGLAFVLDLIAGSLGAGQTTHQIALDPEHETGLSQVFIAIDPLALSPDVTPIASRMPRSHTSRPAPETSAIPARERSKSAPGVCEKESRWMKRYGGGAGLRNLEIWECGNLEIHGSGSGCKDRV